MNSDKRNLLRGILADLETKTGRLTPDAVVAHAKDEDSPLHECFEWDDSKAAHAHRLDQARSLITSVKVEVKTETKTVNTVFYVRDPSLPASEQGYVSVTKLRSEHDLARDAVVDAFSQARAMMERAQKLSAALRVEEDVEKIINDITAVKAKAEMQIDARH